MSTGAQWSVNGLTPAQHVQYLRKHIELIHLERARHKHVLAQLRHIQSFARLSRHQVQEVAGEIEWRRRELSRLAATRLQKHRQLWNWTRRAQLATERSERTQINRCEERISA